MIVRIQFIEPSNGRVSAEFQWNGENNFFHTFNPGQSLVIAQGMNVTKYLTGFEYKPKVNTINHGKNSK